MGKDYFISSSGLHIDFVKGWFESKCQFPYGIKTFKEFVEKCFDHPQDTYPKTIEFFINKLAITQFFLDTLSENLSVLPRWNRILDIGTGPAIHPRVLRLLGFCKETYGIDILDRSNDYPDAVFKQTCDFFYNLMMANDFSENKRATLANAAEVFKSVGHHGSPFYISSLLNQQRDFSLTKYIVDDFMKWDSKDLSFDLITGFMCIEYFKIAPFIQKISNLLNKGGIFYFIVDYWYGIWGQSMQLPMDAPWLHTRLSLDDIKRYYRECRGDIYKYAEKAIYFGSSHITSTDYINTANKYGLKLILCRRSFDENVNEYVWKINEMSEYFFKQVLPQAQKINPNVTNKDFFTRYLTMAFIKAE